MNENKRTARNSSIPNTSITSISASASSKSTGINDEDDNIDKKDPLNAKSSTLYTYTSTSLTGKILTIASPYLISSPTHRGSALPAFICLALVTCANYMLGPMRDAAALAVGVSHIPALTLASTWLALASSVPVGWLFEAPDPRRRNAVWKRFGFTRGETQGTSLALFYRVFAIFLSIYAIAFKLVESPDSRVNQFLQFLGTPFGERIRNAMSNKIGTAGYVTFYLFVHLMKLHSLSLIWGVTSEAMEYEEQGEIREGAVQDLDEGVHPSSNGKQNNSGNEKKSTGGRSRIRLKRLAFVGFGGTMGGIIGSIIVSFTAHILRLSGLLVIAAIFLEISANLSIELGKIMQRHWEEEQREILIMAHHEAQAQKENINGEHVVEHFPENGNNLDECYMEPTKLEEDYSLKRNISSGSMKRVASGNSMNSGGLGGLRQSKSCGAINKMREHSISSHDLKEIDASIKRNVSIGSMKRVASGNSINGLKRSQSNSTMSSKRRQSFGSEDHSKEQKASLDKGNLPVSITPSSSNLSQTNTPQNINLGTQNLQEEKNEIDENSFKQRLLRGVMTIVKSRLLLTIFTYNALYASTSVLLSFQRAQLVADRSETSSSHSSAESDTAFLAKINMASSVAVFALQASGLGAFIANSCGQRGTLSLMPVVRFCGVILLAWWHVYGQGKPPNLLLFLILDEFTRVINFAVAKPVRESLWRGLSNEARYEAKPIVDTLANRWGGGSAAFIVGCMNKFLDLLNFGDGEYGNRTIFGFPPTLILLLVISGWWTGVSAHLGYVRNKIDIELKKHE